jgi:hypothetical protein
MLDRCPVAALFFCRFRRCDENPSWRAPFDIWRSTSMLPARFVPVSWILLVLTLRFVMAAEERISRTWTSADGNFSVRAAILGYEDQHVMLRRDDDGREIRVPVSALSHLRERCGGRRRCRTVAIRERTALVTRRSSSATLAASRSTSSWSVESRFRSSISCQPTGRNRLCRGPTGLPLPERHHGPDRSQPARLSTEWFVPSLTE